MPDPGSQPRHANRLAGETSPYLLQHAHNPVDWLPWGPDALARARLLDRPIFLSIGYAACHWCHVMERESFEDEATAAILNTWFVPVKVDREERPDIDQVYMAAIQAMTGSGGWPMSVFLTPEGRPFYGGTYFPDTPRHGMPSFRQVLDGVRRAWGEQRPEVEQAGTRLVAALAELSGAGRTRGGREAGASGSAPGAVGTGAMELDPAVLDSALEGLIGSFDVPNGGWGGAPKFPQPMAVEYLLRRHLATGDERALAVARRTLDAMADGGIRDQLGGGFHRYSTDARWLAPHFEQMLYDNAQLARVYLHAWSVTGADRYRVVAMEAIGAVLRDFTTADGAFAASRDADTEGVEGATYTWRADEVREALGPDAGLFSSAFDVTEQGNWEGVTILRRVRATTELAADVGLGESEIDERLVAARATLLARRDRRQQPARDDKALAAWNGLMLGALGDAARLLGASLDPATRAFAATCLRAADQAATTIVDGLVTGDGRLWRSWKDGRRTGAGVLEDHADLADGLLALYEAGHGERWFRVARSLADLIVDRFADPDGGFFDTADDHERLVTRPRDPQDNAIPSGGAMATRVLLRLHAWTGEQRYRAAAERALAGIAPLATRHPTAFAAWLSALDLALSWIDEIAIVGPADDPTTGALIATIDASWRPNAILSVWSGAAGSAVPLLEGRTMLDGRPTAHVCRGFACRLPVTEPAALASQLAGSA
jgi:uncharacterized protein YyaL (SSP411 family)